MRLASSLQVAVTLVALLPAARAQIDEARPPADRGTPPERILEQGTRKRLVRCGWPRVAAM